MAGSAGADRGVDARTTPIGQGQAPEIGRSLHEGFASLPDRGDLAAYPDEPVVRRAGPYTWHRADISEAHALRAIAGGVLSITAPSGERLRFEFDRLVEHDSGDWTWIGHVAGGSDIQNAIITFGSNAVFGSIAQPGSAPLKLAMQDGTSWLVETDVAARAAQLRASGLYLRPDTLVVPELPDPAGMASRAAAVRAAGAATMATATVDVLIGYTGGFVAAHGGTSAALTRINSIIDTANEAYADSQVDGQVRLVHAMQVNYTDTNGNSSALEALTGSDGSSTPVLSAVDPALRPMHLARDQFGADLVTLLRDFQHPEAVSCGVAWHLGGGLNQIHGGYAPYGLSVVSDGADGGFFCGDTTYVHEVGHNMGLAHDVDTSKGDDGVLDNDEYGTHEYSFGYRTGLAQGSFYTVMAYPDDQVNEATVFSNPDINCFGFACGVPDQADNARSLRQTMAIIAAFRQTVVVDPQGWVRGDIDGDGAADLLWRNGSTGQNVAWLGANAGTPQPVAGVGTAWHVAGIGDIDGDGEGDIVWRNASNGLNSAWSGGDRNSPIPMGSAPGNWTLGGIGDFDGDTKSDLLWRNPGTGQNVIWYSGNIASAQSLAITGGAWHVAGIGDFDADGRDDIFWRNGTTGQNSIWRSGDSGTSISVRNAATQWTLVGVGDFDGTGTSDLLWRDLSSGRNVIWRSADATTPMAVLSVPPAWVMASAGDFNGDGEADLVWRNSTGANRLWLSANANNSQVLQGVASQHWQVVP